MRHLTRREFLQTSGGALTGAGLVLRSEPLLTQEAVPGNRPERAPGVTLLNPRTRVPVSFIIDDSTCLANLAHFCIPQFAEVFPDRYTQPWKRLPREIPDAFVRKFAEWCHARGVKGKYSVVPYPACVGWIDRDLPGWSKQELLESLNLVRTVLAPDWDFHPEMITHTWAIDTKTGRPFPERSENQMENWGFSAGKSTDQLADYIAYALRVLKNVGLPCEGITTPGGFGNRARPQLAQATLQAGRAVFQTEIPHYFRHLFTDDRSVAPRVEYASGLAGSDPQCVVSIIGCTGDWFGGWDGLTRGSVDKFITEDLGGRLPQVIAKQEPAILVCHWPGLYFNGQEVGFTIFQEVVRRLHAAYDHLHWMKLSEIARYWAARELTRIEQLGNRVTFHAPFASPDFTVEITATAKGTPKLFIKGSSPPLKEVAKPLNLAAGAWTRHAQGVIVCFDLPKGVSRLEFS